METKGNFLIFLNTPVLPVDTAKIKKSYVI